MPLGSNRFSIANVTDPLYEANSVGQPCGGFLPGYKLLFFGFFNAVCLPPSIWLCYIQFGLISSNHFIPFEVI